MPHRALVRAPAARAADSGRVEEQAAPTLIADDWQLCRLLGRRARCTRWSDVMDALGTGASLPVTTGEFRAGLSCVGEPLVCNGLGNLLRRAEPTPLARWGFAQAPNEMGRERAADTHACVASERRVACSGGEHFGEVGPRVGETEGESVSGLVEMEGLMPDTLTLWTHATCVGRRGGEVYCWGAFGNPSERIPEQDRPGVSTPTLVGRVDGLRWLTITQCGVCALSSRSLRCWHARDHRVANATPTPEVAVSEVASVVYDPGNSVLCLVRQGTLQCADAGSRRRCTSDRIDATRAGVQPLPEGASSVVVGGGYICTIDGRGETRCASTESAVTGQPFSWQRLAL